MYFQCNYQKTYKTPEQRKDAFFLAMTDIIYENNFAFLGLVKYITNNHFLFKLNKFTDIFQRRTFLRNNDFRNSDYRNQNHEKLDKNDSSIHEKVAKLEIFEKLNDFRNSKNNLPYESDREKNCENKKMDITCKLKNLKLKTEIIQSTFIDILPTERNNYSKETQTNIEEYLARLNHEENETVVDFNCFESNNLL